MHDQHGEGTAAIWLPVALAQNRNAGLDFDQAVVRLRKVGPAREEETGEGLQVAAAQKRARRERLETRVRLRAPHSLILNTGEHFCRAMRRRARERVMPIFEYVCRECRHRFEALVYGSQKAECPKCHSGNLAPQLSTFAVATKGSASAAASTGPCGSCGDPAGPGACSLRNFN
jgi:putative FmdB family regulatory protein